VKSIGWAPILFDLDERWEAGRVWSRTTDTQGVPSTKPRAGPRRFGTLQYLYNRTLALLEQAVAGAPPAKPAPRSFSRGRVAAPAAGGPR
jgi:hypothetical protein